MSSRPFRVISASAGNSYARPRPVLFSDSGNILSNPVTYAQNATGSGTRYDVYTNAEMNALPWGAVTTPGSVVNVHYKSEPYPYRIGLRGVGTEANPIIVNGVTDAFGNRPKMTGAIVAAGCNPSGGYTGPNDVFKIDEQHLGIIVTNKGTQDADATYKPRWIQVKNLEVYGVADDTTFTTLAGGTQVNNDCTGLRVQRGADILFQNCVVTDCAFGIFTQVNGQSAAVVAERVTVRSCRVSGCGVVNEYQQHNMYLQGDTITVEYCYSGGLRSGAAGSSIKIRAANVVVRYNHVEAFGRTILDIVHSEASGAYLSLLPKYGVAYVYGNTLIGEHNIHFGGDNPGEDEMGPAMYPPDIGTFYEPWGDLNGDFLPYMQQLYFYNNTYVLNSAEWKLALFRVSLRDCRVDAWNNIFVVSGGMTYPSWVWYAGQFHLWSNNVAYHYPGTTQFIFDSREDSANPDNYEVTKHAALITTNPLFVDFATRDLRIQVGSSAENVGQSQPGGMTFPPTLGWPATLKSAWDNPSIYPVQYSPRVGTNGGIVRASVVDAGAHAVSL